MTSTTKREDLRVIKTRRSLNSAMYSLLINHKFPNITVRDVCTAALVSRSAFYTHYKDKYDLLSQWLNELLNTTFKQEITITQLTDVFIQTVRVHSAVIMNLLEDADREQQDLLLQFLSQIVSIVCPSDIDLVLSDFVTGGLLNVITKRFRDNKHNTDDETVKSTIGYLFIIVKRITEIQIEPES